MRYTKNYMNKMAAKKKKQQLESIQGKLNNQSAIVSRVLVLSEVWHVNQNMPLHA